LKQQPFTRRQRFLVGAVAALFALFALLSALILSGAEAP